jgi:hypothetical protein
MRYPKLLWLVRICFGVGCLLALIATFDFFMAITYRGPEPFTNIAAQYTMFFTLMSIGVFMVAGTVQVLIHIEENTRETSKTMNEMLKRLGQQIPSKPPMKETSVTAFTNFGSAPER